uniref:C-type lectin domain-containing protein n=1 Tax=Paramormyrops kingsleyae TaxID=1676925 RepID=A0A3B3R9C7_9TELE
RAANRGRLRRCLRCAASRGHLGGRPQCPDGWVHYGRNCYLISRKIKQWQEAAQACDVAAPGAHLLDTDTEEELAFVSSFLQSLNLVLLWTSLNDIQVSDCVVFSKSSKRQIFFLSDTL